VPRRLRAGAGRDGHRGGRRPPRAHGRPGAGAGHRKHALGRRRAPRASGERPAGGRPVVAAPAAGRPGRPEQARQLPRARRLRGAAGGVRHGPGRCAARGRRRQAARARRGGLPDRPKVGRRRAQREAAALPDLQRRRVRARHVQGPRHPRERPVLHRRGDDDRGVRDRLRARLPVPPRRVPARVGAPGRRGHRGAGPRLPRRQHPRPGHPVRHRVAQGRGRVHLRRGDGALQLDRGLPRRAAQQAAVPGRPRAVRQADGHQQRRDARQRPRHRPRRRAGVREDRHRGLEGHPAVLPERAGRAARPVRGAVRHHAARGPRHGGRRAGRATASHDHARRGRRPVRDARRARHRDVVRGDARGGREHGLRGRHGRRRHRRSAGDPHAPGGVLPRRVVRPVRPLPRRDRAPGGGARAPRQRAPARVRRGRVRAARRDHALDARRVDLRPRPDRRRRDRVRAAQARRLRAGGRP